MAMTIYYIESNHAIKIGCTQKTASERLRQMQPNSAAPLVLLGSHEGMHSEEAALHQRFSEIRVHGEWFRRTPELLAHIAESCIDFENISGGAELHSPPANTHNLIEHLQITSESMKKLETLYGRDAEGFILPFLRQMLTETIWDLRKAGELGHDVDYAEKFQRIEGISWTFGKFMNPTWLGDLQEMAEQIHDRLHCALDMLDALRADAA